MGKKEDKLMELKCPEKNLLVIMRVLEKKNQKPAFIKSHNIGTRRHSSKLLGHWSKTEKSVMFFMLFLCTAGSEVLKFALSGDCLFICFL